MRRAIAITVLGTALALPEPALLHAEDWSLTRPRESKPERRRPSAPRAGGEDRAGDAPARAERLRQRYLKVLLREPEQEFSLERLLALYRERDGGLQGLVAELAQRREAGDSYPLAMLVGRVQRARDDHEAARAAYRAAAALAPDSPAPYRALAAMAPPAEAEGLLQQALSRSRSRDEKTTILRSLAEHALDQQDFEAAERRYAELSSLLRDSVYQAAEYARALATRNHHARAVEAYRAAIDSLRGDNRVLPPLLLELARTQLALEPPDDEGALATLARARKLAGPSAGVRYAIDEVMVEAHRRAGRLPELAERLEQEAGKSFESQAVLGRIHDELGDHEAALAAYQRALSMRPRDIDTLQRVVQILQRLGKLKEAIAAYEALVRSAPREPRFVVELAQLLLESGKRKQALSLLARTGRRFPRDARLHRALFELYSRWDEDARARDELKLLVRIEPQDPSHLMALGEERLEQGDRAGALATWRKLLHVGGDRAEAHATLAMTYLDHDMPERALSEFEAAVQLAPDHVEHRRGLAETLERLRRFSSAAEQWEKILASPSTDRPQRREARRRLVRVWARTGELPGKVREFEAAFHWSPSGPDDDAASKPADVEAGRFLAESYHRLSQGRNRRRDPRYLRAAEQVLARVIELAPGDVESMLALERLRALAGHAEGAIEVLERLVTADPKNARSYLARMAQHALSLYRDEDALAYARRSVSLNPDDGSAHERLGELYRARQQIDAAIDSYRRAVELKPHAYNTYFVLAELQLSRGNSEQAERLLRQVMRSSADDELVKRAARALIQQHLGSPRLSGLEQELLPLALGHPQRPIFRRMLVELYDALARPWMERVHLEGEQGAGARRELSAIGQRGIKPLLEALSDDDPAQRRVAIDILGYLDNEHAALPLLRVAEGDGETLLRRQALLAAGALGVNTLAPRFAAFTALPERRLWDAAAWALSRLSGPAALEAQRRLMEHAAAAVRAYAVLGLGRQRDRASLPLLERAARGDRSERVRAAAALALGLSGERASAPLLVTLLRSSGPPLASAAAVALGMLAERDAAPALAEALFSPEPELREAALWGLVRLSGSGGRAGDAALPGLPPEPVAGAAGPLLGQWLAHAKADAASPVSMWPELLRQAAHAALRGPPADIAVALQLLGPQSPLCVAGDDAGLVALRGSLAPALIELVDHPDAAIREAAVGLLGTLSTSAASGALVAALRDEKERVRRATLEALGPAHAEQALSPVAAVAREDGAWWMRLRAVEALSRMGDQRAAPALARVLRGDAYAYVREAAARGLGVVSDPHGRAALARAAREDAEARVRSAARRALAQAP